MPFWIAVTFEHVDDLEPVVPIAEEEYPSGLGRLEGRH